MDLEWIATDENNIADDISRNNLKWLDHIPNRECHLCLSDLMSDSPQARGRERGKLTTRWDNEVSFHSRNHKLVFEERMRFKSLV